MKQLFKSIAALLLIAGVSRAGQLVNVSGASGIAIDGYDPVAFFTEKQPTHGDPAIKATHEGAVYLFSSEKNKAAFTENPGKFAPQFGGYCAYGISVGAVFPVDISTWQVRDERLYFNLNPEVLKSFNKDFAGHVAKAEKNWPEVISKK